MTKVALVTDSTASIPQEYLERYGIRVAPQILVWGNETYRDGVDIQSSEFFERLSTTKVMPTTSQASPQSFHEIYQELLEQDYAILTILISEELSGTLASARQARDYFPEAPIEIIDSRTTAMAMGYIVLMAARAAEEGATLQQCKALAETARDNTGVIFAVDTLEFLHRGGSIGGGARLLGTALNLTRLLEGAGGAAGAPVAPAAGALRPPVLAPDACRMRTIRSRVGSLRRANLRATSSSMESGTTCMARRYVQGF